MNKVTFNNLSALDYPSAEAFNTLSTNLSLCGANVRTIMVTSCHASEGKSFTAFNVAKTLADLGHSVALVDADLRRSVLASKYRFVGSGDEAEHGIVHYLAGMAEADEVICTTNVERLFFVPIGRTVMNSLALLNNTRMPELFSYLFSFVDYVIVDVPPVGVIIDAAEIAKYCDGTLFVVGYNTVHRKEMIEAKQQIERTGCQILGVALNNVELDSYSSKKHYYKSYYSSYGSDYYRSTENSDTDAQKKRRGGKK